MPSLETIRFHNPKPLAGLTGFVDFDNAVIHGVSLISGELEAKGHKLFVDGTTLKQLHALGKAMGQIPVTLDHGGGVTSIAGFVDNVRLDGSKVRGDWHLLKTHNETETMLERADKMPNCFGMSCAFKGPPKGVMTNGKACARAEELLSVDCVTRPAANPDGMFSAIEDDLVDTPKLFNRTKVPKLFNFTSMAKTTNTAEEPTIAELVEAINELNSRQEAAEAARAEAGGDDTLSPEQIATLESLYNGSEAFLANYNRQNGTKVTRADINAAVDQFNASVDAAGGGDGDGDGSWDGDGDGGEVAGGAAAAAVAGGETSAAGTQLAAVHRELIQLKAKIDRKERIELQQAETLEFEAVEHNFAVLTEQRDQAIELAEKLVAENEALRLHLSTGTRPVRAGLDNGVRLFHAVDGELHEFQQNVKARMKADKISEGKAIMLESHENPALHADWVNSNRTVRA